MSSYRVTRCICHNRSFEEIREYARKYELTSVEELQSENYCSCSCKMCVPYVEQVLKSGQTEFIPGAYYKS